MRALRARRLGNGRLTRAFVLWELGIRLAEVAAAALQHLATQAGARSDREVAGLMSLLKVLTWWRNGDVG